MISDYSLGFYSTDDYRCELCRYLPLLYPSPTAPLLAGIWYAASARRHEFLCVVLTRLPVPGCSPFLVLAWPIRGINLLLPLLVSLPILVTSWLIGNLIGWWSWAPPLVPLHSYNSPIGNLYFAGIFLLGQAYPNSSHTLSSWWGASPGDSSLSPRASSICRWVCLPRALLAPSSPHLSPLL